MNAALKATIGALAVTIVLAGCGGPDRPRPAATPTPTPPASTTASAAPPAPTSATAQPTQTAAPIRRKDCSDFGSQAAAQQAMQSGQYDLDQDGDGLACEVYFEQKTGRSTARQPAPPKAHIHTQAPSAKKPHVPSGHPCLPGERDGDGDGFCGERR